MLIGNTGKTNLLNTTNQKPMASSYNYKQSKKELDSKIAMLLPKVCKTSEGKWLCTLSTLVKSFRFVNGHSCQSFARLMSHRYTARARVYKEGKLQIEYETFRGPLGGVIHDRTRT